MWGKNTPKKSRFVRKSKTHPRVEAPGAEYDNVAPRDWAVLAVPFSRRQ